MRKDLIQHEELTILNVYKSDSRTWENKEPKPVGLRGEVGPMTRWESLGSSHSPGASPRKP